MIFDGTGLNCHVGVELHLNRSKCFHLVAYCIERMFLMNGVFIECCITQQTVARSLITGIQIRTIFNSLVALLVTAVEKLQNGRLTVDKRILTHNRCV